MLGKMLAESSPIVFDITKVCTRNAEFFRKFGLRQSGIFPIRADIIRWRDAFFKILVFYAIKDTFEVFVGFILGHGEFFTELVAQNTKNRHRDKAANMQISTGRFHDCQHNDKGQAMARPYTIVLGRDDLRPSVSASTDYIPSTRPC